MARIQIAAERLIDSMKRAWRNSAVIRNVCCVALLSILIAAAALTTASQPNADLQTFFREDIGFTQDQIDDIRNGQPVTKALASRTPAEVFLFGAVYIHAAPESYVQFATDFDRLRKLPGYLALGVIGNPPKLSDLKDLSFDNDDIQELKRCKPGDCQIQMPTSSIEELQQSIDWSAPDVNEQVNRLLRKTALQRLLDYQREGNQALGEYNDKREPTEVPRQFAYMLSNDKVLPERLPAFYHYLLSYPHDKPANVNSTFYWERVKFGLKPTVRVVQVLTLRGNPADQVACAIAEKQLYASHYFETALDLSFCVRGDGDGQPGFYLIMALGSEQLGLTGFKGSILRKVAVGRSVSNLQDALKGIKDTLESGQ